MTDDLQSCEHANVTTAAGVFEHYNRRGPGCWHPVDGNSQCRSWQALVEHVQSVAAARAEARVRAEVAEELAWIFEKRAAQEQGPFERRDPAAVAFLEAARTARSRAGSSRDTTPPAKDHEMEGAPIAGSGSNLKSPGDGRRGAWLAAEILTAWRDRSEPGIDEGAPSVAEFARWSAAVDSLLPHTTPEES